MATLEKAVNKHRFGPFTPISPSLQAVKAVKAVKASKSIQANPRPSKTIQDHPRQIPDTMDIYQSLAHQFRRLVLDDPAVQRLANGYILWGDIRVTDQEVAFHAKWAQDETETQAAAALRSADTVVAEYDQEANWWVTPETAKPKPVVTHEHEHEHVAIPVASVGIKTLIARNLPRDITVEALRTIFEKYGPIKDIYIPRNMEKTSPLFGTVKGFALIKFLQHANSAAAYSQQYGRLTIDSHHIALEFAKQDRD